MSTHSRSASFLTALRPWLIALALYLALACLVTWPAVLNLSGAFIGHHTGDSYEMGHHLWWIGYALKTGQPVFTQALLGYPDGIAGISLWSNPLQFFPAWLFAMALPVALAYNLQVLLTMALNGVTMAYLLSRIGKLAGWTNADRLLSGPALIAGAAFLTFPVFQGHLFGGHGGLMVMWPVPLYAAALLALRDGFTWRRFGAAVLWFVVSPWGHTLQAIYVLMPLTGLFVLALIAARQWRAAMRVVSAAALGAVILIAVFALPVAADAFSETYSGDQGYVAFSADLLGLVTPSFESPLLGGVSWSRSVLGTNLIEGLTYYGLIAAGLTALAVWKLRESRWWLLLAVVAAVLALGPVVTILGRPATLRLDTVDSFVTMPWGFAYNLPGFSLARTPGRFSFTVALAAAVLIGMGAAVLWRGRGRALAALLGVLIVVEYQSFWPMPSMDATIPAPILALRDRTDVRAVMDMPWGNLLAAKHGMYLQTGHEKPLIAGQVTRRTPVDPAKLDLLETWMDPALFDLAGVDIVIVHRAYDPGGVMFGRMNDGFGPPVYEDAQFAMFEVPEPTQAATSGAVIGPTTAGGTRIDVYAYLTGAGWMTLTGDVRTSPGRAFTIALDGATAQARTLNGRETLNIDLYAAEAGFHTVTLALSPDCPTVFPSPYVACSTLGASNLGLEIELLDTAPVSATVEQGITLHAARLPESAQAGDMLDAGLWWSFEAALDDQTVRFVKLLDAENNEIAGQDLALGPVPAGSVRTDRVTLALPADLPAGDYELVAGWYRLPDVTRLAVTSEGPRAQDGLIALGTVRVR
ncbi:MAG: hypothetical protein IPM16_15160 [Chloroflexi bacterium]|nr:hypothetical protein [Chloroflexota bacterium]